MKHADIWRDSFVVIGGSKSIHSAEDDNSDGTLSLFRYLIHVRESENPLFRISGIM